eukprot:TRINITY_DN21723_c0_g1_i1.p1 TRINITY_DN21723_c0_g1~~TRINITY_DN21723_c0_g1_i1.p1  ORF type:complete len:316 (+),score=114.52 TRINITY_DN21723_c0_g1_i1:88-948(+)
MLATAAVVAMLSHGAACDVNGLKKASGRYITALETGDAEGWAQMFAPYGTVEDPVGADVLSRHDERVRFYNMFYSQRHIEIEHALPDVIDTDALRVIKTLRITSGLLQGARHTVPVHLHLHFARNGSDYRIVALRSFWDPSESQAVVSNHVVAAIPHFFVGSLMELGSIVTHGGLTGALRYFSALSVDNVGPKGLRAAVQIRDDPVAVQCSPTAVLRYQKGDVALDSSMLLDLSRQFTWSNLRTSGMYVSFNVHNAGSAGAGYVLFSDTATAPQVEELAIFLNSQA